MTVSVIHPTRAGHTTRVPQGPPSQAWTAAQARTRRNNINLMLWTFQGWLAMFYAGTGYAKVSEPIESLGLLMGWPRHVDPDIVQLLGLADIGMALGMLWPLLSWKLGRPVLVGAAAVMVMTQLVFLAYYGVEQRGWMVGINLALLGVTATVLRIRGGLRR